MVATSVGGISTTATTEKILMTLFCSMRDHAEHGVEQERDLVAQIGGVIGQRLDVALHALELRARVLGPAHAVGLVGEEQQQAADRDQALAHLRGEVALAADGLEDVVVALRAVGARASGSKMSCET